MTPTEPSRRTVLRWGMTAIGALGTVSLLAACGGTSATTTAATVTTTQASTATGAKTEVSQAASTAALTALKTVSPAAGVPAKGITVTVASWLAQTPSRAAYQFLATQYAKMTPRVQIEQLLIPGSSSYADKLTALLAGGTPPDLAETNWIESQPLGEKGALRALDPLIARDKIAFQDYAQVALALGRWPQQAGKYYAWYTMFATSPLYYNTTLFQRAGQAPPDATWTWQHLVEIARKLFREMRDKKKVSISNVYVPNEYKINLHSAVSKAKNDAQAVKQKAIATAGSLKARVHAFMQKPKN